MSRTIHKQRAEALAKAMRRKKLPYVLLEDMKHTYYFSGFSIAFPGVRFRVCLLVDAKGGTTLLVSAPLADSAGSHADEVIPVDHSLVDGAAKREAKFARALKAATRQSRTALKKAAAVIGPDIALMRRRKDAEDKRQLRRLARLAQIGYAAAEKECIAGRTELDLFLAAKTACVNANKRDLFVFGDFVSGKRSSGIDGPPTTRKLKTGENVIIDLWLVGDHYWSDTAQTFFVGGEPTEKQRSLLKMLERTKRRAERAIRPGVKAVNIYRQMQDDLGEHGYRCPHHMGHGFGLDSWEPPFITADSTDVFQEDMAFNLELGIYDRKHQGFRIEAGYFVTGTGVTCLKRFS